MSLGAKVIVLDESDLGQRDKADAAAEASTSTSVLGAGATASCPRHVDLVVTSPGWRRRAPLLRQAAAAGVPCGARSSWPGA
jgi:UDP-N-acetylmuramoylalanine-D-glutamate ligase